MITATTSCDDLYETALAAINELEPGEVFITKDLFRGFEWNRMKKNTQSKLTGRIRSFEQTDGAEIIKYLGTTPRKTPQFKKI